MQTKQKNYTFVAKLETMESNFTTFIALENKRALILANPVKIKEKSKTGKTTKIREIAYVPTLDTIYVDEMKKADPKFDVNENKQHIKILKGKIKVDNSEKNMLDFLKAHPQNEENGGRAFKLLDINAEEDFETQIIDEITDARYLIKNADDIQLKAIAYQMLGFNYKHKTVSRCKIDLINAIENRRLSKEQLKSKTAKSFAKQVADWFANKEKNEALLVIATAIDKNVLSFRNGGKAYLLGMTAQDEDTLLYTANSTSKVMQEFADFLRIDEKGIEIMQSIAKRIKK